MSSQLICEIVSTLFWDLDASRFNSVVAILAVSTDQSHVFFILVSDRVLVVFLLRSESFQIGLDVKALYTEKTKNTLKTLPAKVSALKPL